MGNKFKVAICLVTYNQELYIRQAIDSVLMQQTTFEYTCFVGDDCSTDNTPAIIDEYTTEYPKNVVSLCTTTNQGIVGNTYNVLQHIFANEEYKYVALLDGDDFWNDSEKLQKQVDFMETNPDYAFVYARMGTCRADGSKYHASTPHNIGNGGDLFPRIITTCICNGTVMHRISLYKKIDWKSLVTWNLLSCDYITNVWMASMGKVGFIDEEVGVWRRGGGSVSSPNDADKIVKYIDHEWRQAGYLAEMFPGTVYDYERNEEIRKKVLNKKLYYFAIAKSNWHLLDMIDWTYLGMKKPWYTKSPKLFKFYMVLHVTLRKCKTAIFLLRRYFKI